MPNQETKVIMSECCLPNESPVECDFHHSGTDLEVDGHHCAEDSRMTEDFAGDHEDHELLSKNTPTSIQRKPKRVKLRFDAILLVKKIINNWNIKEVILRRSCCVHAKKKACYSSHAKTRLI